jgi:putative iron-dependent peroxidase
MGLHLTFRLRPGADRASLLGVLRSLTIDETLVVGLGRSLVLALDGNVEALRSAPGHAGPGLDVPSTPAALWCWLRGSDRGVLLHAGRRLVRALDGVFALVESIETFQYDASRDLTGYEDGTENPKGDAALEAAIARGGAGLEGSSFVAVQRWVHDLNVFEAQSPEECDFTIGRRVSDNEEIEDAPASAHTKRTAQESFDPEAFVLRRSMPYSSQTDHGLVFVAFGRSFDAFEAQLHRMVGAEDGVTDALFRFTRPVTSAFFWCPPIESGRLVLGAAGV